MNGCFTRQAGEQAFFVDLLSTVLVAHKCVFSHVILKAVLGAKRSLGSENCISWINKKRGSDVFQIAPYYKT